MTVRFFFSLFRLLQCTRALIEEYTRLFFSPFNLWYCISFGLNRLQPQLQRKRKKWRKTAEKSTCKLCKFIVSTNIHSCSHANIAWDNHTLSQSKFMSECIICRLRQTNANDELWGNTIWDIIGIKCDHCRRGFFINHNLFPTSFIHLFITNNKTTYTNNCSHYKPVTISLSPSVSLSILLSPFMLIWNKAWI